MENQNSGNALALFFDQFNSKLDTITQQLSELRGKVTETREQKIPFTTFCRDQEISRVTGYAWEEKGLIKTELINRRRYVLSNSVLIPPKKYQRA